MERTLEIELSNIEKIYGYGRNALKVLNGISIEVEKGEILSVVGPSGAGKSTLLNLIGCLDFFQNGRIIISGRDISNMKVEELAGFRNNHIGFIFQQHNLLPEFTALENIMIPLLIRRTPKKEARDRSYKLLERFDLTGRAQHKPMELSGGECQRIAVGRAIVGKPDIILADEPTGSLDRTNSGILTDSLMEIGKENNTTILIVTHDMEVSSRTERKISLIDGKIVDDAYIS